MAVATLPAPEPRVSRKGLLVAMALVAVVGVIALVFVLMRRDSGSGNQGAAHVVAPVAATAPAAFAGSASCRECHAEEFAKWQGSHHGLAEREIDPKVDLAAFSPERSFTHGSQTTTVRQREKQFEVLTPGLSEDGKLTPTAIVPTRVIGEAPLRQFLVPMAGGRLQTLEASYDPHKNEWFNVYGNEDRKPGEWGHWTGRGMNWNAMCAACHNTDVRKNYDVAADTYNTTVAERTVSCESCHGPMKPHVDEATKRRNDGATKGGWAKDDKGGTLLPAGKTSAIRTPRATLSTCGSCHARRGELTGAFIPGDEFTDHYWLTVPDQTDLFYPDGQIREEDYEYTSFLSSKMHSAGVRCVDCHDPHAGKPVLQGNALCMKCHNGSFPNSVVIDPAKHTFHQPQSTGAQCVSCHMPQTVYMQRHSRHDHGFTLPDPLLTKQLQIPNACNRCHTDKDADWSITHVDQWYGAKMERPTRARARIIAAARRNERGAQAGLMSILSQEKIPLWRASAATLLGNYLNDPAVPAALTAAAADKEALLRDAAARAMTPLGELQAAPNYAPPIEAARAMLARMINDPSRGVRIRAAWALRGVIEQDAPATGELLAFLNHNADQPAGALQMGVWHVSRNQLNEGVGWFEKSVKWDPNSAPLRDSYAVGLAMQGNLIGALDQLKHAVRIDPRDAELWYKLGLSYNETNQPAMTISALEKAVQVAPTHSRALYNLGLAYSAAGDRAKAIDTLNRAQIADPQNPNIPFALSTIYLAAGDRASARAAAIRTLQLAPGHREAMQVLRQLGE